MAEQGTYLLVPNGDKMSDIIRNLKCIKLSEMIPMIQNFLDNNMDVRVTVTGGSMYPFLRDCIDSVLLTTQGLAKLKIGDIVLYKRINGQYVLHRIVKSKKDNFYMTGDAQKEIEGPIKSQQILCVVKEIYRINKRIQVDRADLSIMVFIWMILRPFRNYIIRLYQLIKVQS